MHDFIQNILSNERLVFVDVGAANGLLPHYRILIEDARLYLVEPNEVSCQFLEILYAPQIKAGTLSIIPFGLSQFGGKQVLYVTNKSTGSSLLEPGSRELNEYVLHDYIFPLKKVEIDTITLETLVHNIQEKLIDIIKLDTQGTELFILKGLGQLSGELLSVEMEIGMPGAYKNQPQLPEIIEYMKTLNLKLFDLKPSHAHRQLHGKYDYYQKKVFSVYEESSSIRARIWEVDTVFFKDLNVLIERNDPSSIRKLIVAYCVHGFFIEAFHAATEAEKAGLFTGDAAKTVQSSIVKWHRKLHYRLSHSSHPVMGLVRKFGHTNRVLSRLYQK